MFTESLSPKWPIQGVQIHIDLYCKKVLKYLELWKTTSVYTTVNQDMKDMHDSGSHGLKVKFIRSQNSKFV